MDELGWFSFCSSGLFLLGLISVTWLVVASRLRRHEQRLQELEAALGQASFENTRLLERTAYLEYLARPSHEAELARRRGPDPRESEREGTPQTGEVRAPVEVAARDDAAQPSELDPRSPMTPPWQEVSAPASASSEGAARAEVGAVLPAASPVSPPAWPVPPAASPVAPPASPGIAWEQWIGVRGAAALGAIILVIAGIYFFEYSIEHGLITPAMRMVAGTLVGLACVMASELRLRRAHEVLANWLAGAGVAILYVAFWAGSALYSLYPSWAAGLLMVAVTGTCVTLAVRRDARAIAVLGLLGGFVTPLALSTGRDQPISLFGYLLLLDVAMLAVAYARRWSWLALLCVIGTAFYQQAWLLERLDEPRLLLGVIVVGVFAVLFVALPRERDVAQESVLWKLTRSAGVLVPLLFTVPLAVRQDLGRHFWPTAVQLALLCVGAAWVGLRNRSDLLPSSAALLGVGTLLGWGVANPGRAGSTQWQFVGVALGLAAIFWVFAEVGRARAKSPEDARLGAVPAILAVLAVLAVVGLGALDRWPAGLAPWWLAWVGLLAMGLRLGSLPGRAAIQLAVACEAALGVGLNLAVRGGHADMPPADVHLGLAVLLAAGVQLAGVLPRERDARRLGEHAAALFAVLLVLFVPFVGRDGTPSAWAFHAGMLALEVFALLAASRVAAAGWLPWIVLASALGHSIWVVRWSSGPFAPIELAGLGASLTTLAIWPLLGPPAIRDGRWAWRASALAGPLYFLAFRRVYLDVLGASTIGLLPVALAALSLGVAFAARARRPRVDEVDGASRTALVWLTTIAAGFITLAIPLQLEREWITIGWALEACVFAAMWRRFDATALKYLALALATTVAVRLVANPYVLDYYGRGSMRVLNWLSYTYLVPFAALVGTWALVRDLEVERRRAWERAVFSARHALLANLAAAWAILVLFAWVNLTIVDWFTTGPNLTIPTERLPARDLSISIAWAVFALGLLALGVLRSSTALRVASLALVLVTSGKVFLYDLAHLRDLYRVASLVGLALSLIVISLAYQRFVFRGARPSKVPPAPPPPTPPPLGWAEPGPSPPPPGAQQPSEPAPPTPQRETPR